MRCSMKRFCSPLVSNLKTDWIILNFIYIFLYNAGFKKKMQLQKAMFVGIMNSYSSMHAVINQEFIEL